MSKAIAVYQGQATLGKIIDVVMHEGRRPLHYFENQIPNLNDTIDKFLLQRDDISRERLRKISDGVSRNSHALSELFNKLNPLATRKRNKAKVFSLTETIQDTLKIFENELKKEKIVVQISPSKNIDFYGWYQDITTIFANLIDNSLYWMKDCKDSKIINISIVENEAEIVIDYTDTGVGIPTELIQHDLIFDPEFTTKNEGSGLGLAISGEAAERNKFKLSALEHQGGAHFRLSYSKEDI